VVEVGTRSTREDILSAARTEFALRGYAGGRTPEIAERAGVTERTVFRHFATKADLFTSAAVGPFHAYIAEFMADWREREPGVRSAWDETREFYAGLFDVLEAHQGLFVALVASRSFEDRKGAAPDGLGTTMSDILDRATESMAAESASRGFRGSPAVNVRFMFGLAVTVCVHGDWLFAAERPSRDAMLDEITGFTLSGLGDRSGA
jgi:AcrR family transcriptional regulator